MVQLFPDFFSANKKYLGVFLSINLRKQLTGPVEVQLMPTSKCDLNCLPCFPFVEESDMDSKLLPALFRSLDILRVGRLVLSGKRNSLLYPNIGFLLKETKKHRFKVGVILNNLTFQKSKLPLLSQFDFFYISMLACTPQSYELVHPNFPFSRFKESISVIKSIGSKAKRLNVTLFEQNYTDAISFLRVGGMLKCPVFFNKAVTPHKPEIEIKDKNHFLEILEQARAFAAKNHIQTNLNGINKTRFWLPPCYQGYWQTSVTASGSVIFCCRHPIKLGNIIENPLEKIWYSKPYGKLRQTRFHEGNCKQECLFRHINLGLSKFDITKNIPKIENIFKPY